MIVRHPVDQDVVHEPAVFVKQPGVVHLSGLELADGVGGNKIDQPLRLRPADFDLAHMADVEQPDRCAHGLVFVHDSRILDRHIPPAEIDHPGLQPAMDGIKRRGAECGS